MLRRRAGELWWLAIPITTSLLIRIVHLLYSARYQELSEFLLLDSLVYLEMANANRQGDWLAGSEVYSVGPLYGYILAAQQALVGDSLLASFAVQAVIGTATVVIVSLWARRFSGHWTASAAGLAYATYSAALLVENKVLGECYGVFLSITGTYLLAHRSKRLYQFIVAGICFGLACLIRPELLLFTPFALLWAAGFDRLGSFRLPFPRINWQAFVTCTVPLCFVISVVAVRNYHVADEAIFISSQGGITFYQGNNPRAEGTFSIPEGMTGDKASQAEESKLLAEQQVGRPLNQIEVNAHWMKRGITYLTTDLSTTLVLMGRKLRYWLSSSELTTEYSVLAERLLCSDSELGHHAVWVVRGCLCGGRRLGTAALTDRLLSLERIHSKRSCCCFGVLRYISLQAYRCCSPGSFYWPRLGPTCYLGQTRVVYTPSARSRCGPALWNITHSLDASGALSGRGRVVQLGERALSFRSIRTSPDALLFRVASATQVLAIEVQLSANVCSAGRLPGSSQRIVEGSRAESSAIASESICSTVRCYAAVIETTHGYECTLLVVAWVYECLIISCPIAASIGSRGRYSEKSLVRYFDSRGYCP